MHVLVKCIVLQICSICAVVEVIFTNMYTSMCEEIEKPQILVREKFLILNQMIV